MVTVKIEALWIYPVKSLAGIAVSSATLATAGLAGDREWMIVDDTGRFITQRQIPRLATIKTALQADQLELSHTELGAITVVKPAGDAMPVKIWKDTCTAFRAASEVNDWLRQALATDQSLSLVYFNKQEPRATNPERFGPYYTHFSDGAPYLVANIASLHALNDRLTQESKSPVDIRRFRPNIVISGVPAFAEHQFDTMRPFNGDAELGLKDHCQRCSVITVDQTSGIPSADTEPFKTLAQLNGMPSNPKAPAFGVNSVLTQGAGAVIRSGDQWLMA